MIWTGKLNDEFNKERLQIYLSLKSVSKNPKYAFFLLLWSIFFWMQGNKIRWTYVEGIVLLWKGSDLCISFLRQAGFKLQELLRLPRNAVRCLHQMKRNKFDNLKNRKFAIFEVQYQTKNCWESRSNRDIWFLLSVFANRWIVVVPPL